MTYKTDIFQAVIRAHNSGHREVAMVFFTMFSHLFTANIKDSKIIIYHRDSYEAEWKESHIVHIKRHLSTTIHDKFVEGANLCFSKAFANGRLVKPKYIDVANKLLRVSHLLHNQTFKQHIVKEVIELLVMSS
jgi:hypothetical protein